MLEKIKDLKIDRIYKVEEHMTARVVKSGGLDVLATPEIIRLVENITFEEMEKYLTNELTTVGGFIDISHLKPTAVNKEFEINITIIDASDKKIEFEFKSFSANQLIASGKHIRYVVNKEKFLSKLN